MKAQRSSENNGWYTPLNQISMFRSVLGSIDLDPASCSDANTIVCADRYFTAEDEPLIRDWAQNNYVNPPGCCDKIQGLFGVCKNEKRCSCGLPFKFMLKAHSEARLNRNTIYMAYSVNQLQQLGKLKIVWPVSIAIFTKRIHYINSGTMSRAPGAPCPSAAILFSRDYRLHDRFKDIMSESCFVSKGGI